MFLTNGRHCVLLLMDASSRAPAGGSKDARHLSLAIAGPAIDHAVKYVSPVIAGLTETWRRRALLAIGIAVFPAGTGMQATAARFPIMMMGSALSGLGAAIYTPVAYIMSAIFNHAIRHDWTHRTRSPRSGFLQSPART
jgi:MFS family permease